MEHIQISAMRTLAASRVFDAAEFSSGLIRRAEADLPDELSARLKKAGHANEDVITYITHKFAELPLQGVDGLKHRTGLMEHRYDIT